VADTSLGARQMSARDEFSGIFDQKRKYGGNRITLHRDNSLLAAERLPRIFSACSKNPFVNDVIL